MERLDNGSPVPAHLRGGIVALGNFDGFHLGHQAVVGRASHTRGPRGARRSSPPSIRIPSAISSRNRSISG
jgi:FAD synthase